MASAATSSANELDLNALLQSLPACRRCRDCRRGCDTVLPRCRQCTKANVECIFYDHGKNENLPRSYIAQLVARLRTLSTPRAPAAASLEPPSSAASSSTPQPESVRSEAQAVAHHFAYAAGSYRYLGADACLVKSPKLQQAKVGSPIVRGDEAFKLAVVSTEGVSDLVRTYLDNIHPLFPIVDPDWRFLGTETPTDLVPAERFFLNMICSIACYLAPGSNRDWRPSGSLSYHHSASQKYEWLAQEFFSRAMSDLETTTREASLATLRAVLLLAINSLFDPKSGNVGQEVALAYRLYINLQEKSAITAMGNEDAKALAIMYGIIFCLENEVASTLDRPTYVREPEWPMLFDRNSPSNYLCSLYRLQHRFRKGDQNVKSLLPPLDERAELNPSLRMVLHQTHLLLNPCWGSAWHVLEAVVSHRTIHIFLTPHWVYRAGCVLVENMPQIWEMNLIQLYSNALVILELSSSKWPNTGVLKDSLVGLMDSMKTKHQPHWGAKGLQLWDVKL